jgi:phosphate:Na+ symporter
MIAFYSSNAVIGFSFMNEPIDAAGIASIHTIFNVFATCVLLPFGNGLEKLAILTVPSDPVKKERTEFENNIRMLDTRFIETPGYALSMAKSVTIKMAETAYDAMELAMHLMKEYDAETGKRVAELEKDVDKYEDLLNDYLLKLSSKDLSIKENNQLTVMLHCINDFERIADHAMNLKESAEEKFSKEFQFSEKAALELDIFSDAIREILDMTLTMFKTDDLKLASCVEPLEEIIDDLSVDMKSRHIARLRKGACKIEVGFILQDLTVSYERVADHCSNIALYVLQEKEEHIDAHRYIGNIKKSGNAEFERQKKLYREKYMLPETSSKN